MSKRSWGVVLLVAVILALGAGAVAWKKGSWEKRSGGEAVWSVVYLSSGEIYVGQLSWGKKPRFEQGYLVMKVANEKDPKQSDIRLQPLAETVWAPTSLTLNPAHILFHGPLDPNSTAAQKLRDRGVLK